MLVKFFACPCQGSDEASDVLNRFLASHRIVSVERHFVQDGHNSFWALCVTFMQPAAGRAGTTPLKQGKIDYREVLPAIEFTTFAKLRSLRKQLADREGIPAYAVFTNEQLAAMVRQRVATPTSLRAVAGVGEARATKYDAEFLAIMRLDLPALGSALKAVADAT